MSTQTPTAYIEITLEETATQAHVPATLYYHEEKQVFLKPVDLLKMLEDCWKASTTWNGQQWLKEGGKAPDRATYINSVLNPPK